ncbi:PREDICTED: uncharacterized protein LOC108369295 [Rhagoletis zephyria]|uniref:uncharacterized protein LOC108369295 n=1 Tax=Rhagoletis zephyria TaxID=28612 RepID=UPI0008114678|nr:PREDICTED: uncharacterized protein LOC108369295 [Rhagoletis zephyria]
MERPSDILRLICLFRQNECLWNFKSAGYKRVDLKRKAWLQISKELGKDVEEVKPKIKHLRTTYVAEKKKMDSSKKSGEGAETLYELHLYYYNEMKFLDSVIVLRKTTSNLEMENVEFATEVLEGEGLDETLISMSPPQESAPSLASSFSSTSSTSCTASRRRKPNKEANFDKALDRIFPMVYVYI